MRDAEGAERCIVSAVRAGATPSQLADMLFAAATDHRYVTNGHVLDFTNKALEALDRAGWERAELVLPSLAAGFACGERMEESNAWRHPVDVVALVEEASEQTARKRRLRGAEPGRPRRARGDRLADDPQRTIQAMLADLHAGSDPVELAGRVAYAAALRIARFHTANEFADWDTALHTFTFANAVQQGLRRSASPGAPPRRPRRRDEHLPRPFPQRASRAASRTRRLERPGRAALALPLLLDRQQQVNEAGFLVASYLAAGGDAAPLLARLGSALLREDRNFHTIQSIEAVFRQWTDTSDPVFLVAGVRYLAAHAPTARAQEQTFTIATRLHRGERLYEEA